MSSAERRLAQLQALDRFSTQLEVGPSIEETLDNLAHSTVDATSAAAAVVVLIEDASEITQVGSCNLPPEIIPQVRAAFRTLQDSPLHQAMRDGSIVRISPDQLPQALLETDLPAFLKSQGINQGLVAPLRTPGGATLGTLHALFHSSNSPDEEDRRFQMTLARFAAVAIENVQLFQTLKQQTLEQERNRLGRELHDSVSQTLFSIGLGAQASLEGLAAGEDGVQESLEYVLSLARTGLEDMRTVLFKLRPESLADAGLVDGLRRNVESLTTRYGIQVETDFPGEPDLSDQLKHALYRIALEALHNSVKHSGASLITLGLKLDEERVTMKIADNGCGFQMNDVEGGHLGLTTMRERTEEFGGEFQLGSEPGEGTSLTVHIPHAGDKTIRSSS